MSVECYVDSGVQNVVIPINAITAGLTSIYSTHLLLHRRSTPGFHVIRVCAMLSVYTRLVGFSMYKGGAGSDVLFRLVTFFTAFTLVVSLAQWTRHVIMALYQSAFGETTTVRVWRIIIPTSQILQTILFIILIFPMDAVVNRGRTVADILLNALIIISLTSVFSVIFTIHLIVYRKVRAMPKPDAKIRKKVRRVMAATFVAVVASIVVFLSQVIAGAASSGVVEELEPTVCNVASIIILECIRNVLGAILLYHTDLKVRTQGQYPRRSKFTARRASKHSETSLKSSVNILAASTTSSETITRQ